MKAVQRTVSSAKKERNGTLVEQYEYDAFGYPHCFSASNGWSTDLPYSSVGNRFLFTGREWSELGSRDIDGCAGTGNLRSERERASQWLPDLKLYDYRARMYQPELGRFVQPDPKEFGAGDYNLYRYCHNDPVNRSDPTELVERIEQDFQWKNARFFDSANTSQTSLAEMNGTQRFLASVKDFTHKERQDGSRIDPKKIGETAVTDAKEDAAKVELRDGGRWGIEQVTGEYADGANLVKRGPEPGLPYKRTPTAAIPKWGDKVPLIGTHAHGPQSGMRAELQLLDEPSANGLFTKGVPYISAVATTVDKGDRVQIYVPHYGYFHSTDGVTFSVGK